MKSLIKPEKLKFLILGAGGLGLALRVILYATGIDGRGLLVADHWAHIALWVLTFAAVSAAFLLTRPIDGPANHATAYPVSFAAAVGAFAAMVGIGFTVGLEFAEFSNRLNLIVWILGLGSFIAMGRIGICRITGKQPNVLLHAVICLYFALRMVSQYRLWSSDPQLQDYCFYLLAYVALMLSAYHHAAFDAGLGCHRSLWFYSLIAVYLCCLSLKGSMDILPLLGCGMWAFTNLTAQTACPALMPDVPAEE